MKTTINKELGLFIYVISATAFALALLGSNTLMAQNPVHDRRHNEETQKVVNSEIQSLVHQTKAALAINKIKKVQEGISKSLTVVNGLIKDMKLVNDIIKLQKDIVEIVDQAIAALNAPIDADGDGLTDNEVIDKWKQIKILLKIADHTDSVFDVFKGVMGSGTAIMDDKGRLGLLKSTRNDLLKIRSGLKEQIHQINKEIYFYTIEKRELMAYKKLFSFDY